jgi:HSP20 family protein
MFWRCAVSVLRFDPFSDPFRQVDRLTNQLLSGTRTPMGMPMDVWQADDGFHVSLDLPGVDPSSVEITTERNILTISAERRPEYRAGQNVLVAERPQGGFTRQLQLGDTVDVENVQATYADGVLHLTLPITQAAQARRIQVQTGGGGERQIEVEAEPAESAAPSGEATQSGS